MKKIEEKDKFFSEMKTKFLWAQVKIDLIESILSEIEKRNENS